MATTTYPVTGMTCEHCVSAVTSELGGLNGVSGVTVDLVPDGSSWSPWPATRHCPSPPWPRPSMRPAAT